MGVRRKSKTSEEIMTQTTPRALVWFSCGAASAVAAKLAVEKYGDACEVLYCDTLAYEHPDNPRFLAAVERWIGKTVKILKSPDYADIFDVFRRTGWLVGKDGASSIIVFWFGFNHVCL